MLNSNTLKYKVRKFAPHGSSIFLKFFLSNWEYPNTHLKGYSTAFLTLSCTDLQLQYIYILVLVSTQGLNDIKNNYTNISDLILNFYPTNVLFVESTKLKLNFCFMYSFDFILAPLCEKIQYISVSRIF